MIIIKLITTIDAPLQTVFDLSRNIKMREICGEKSNEQAVDGVISGLLKLNNTFTVKAKHFGMSHKFVAEISDMNTPNSYIEEMLESPFISWNHEHLFEEINDKTEMTDILKVGGLSGMLAMLLDNETLEKYLAKFIKERNLILKDYAETDKWQAVLS